MARTSIEFMNARRDRKPATELGGPHASHSRMWAAMQRARTANVGPGTWEHCLADARRRWASAKLELLNDYAAAVLNGPRSDVYDNIPF